MALFESGGKLNWLVEWKDKFKFRFLEGAEVAKREVFNDIEQEVIVSGNGEKKEGDPGADAEEKNERRVGAPSQPAVVGVLCLRSSLFLVQVKYRDATKVMFSYENFDLDHGQLSARYHHAEILKKYRPFNGIETANLRILAILVKLFDTD